MPRPDPDDRAPISRPTQANDATIDAVVAWLSDGGISRPGGDDGAPEAVASAGLHTRGQLAHALLERVRRECEPTLRLRAAEAEAEAAAASAAASSRHVPLASASKPLPPPPGFDNGRGPGGHHRARHDGVGPAASKTGSRLPGIDIDDAAEFPSLGAPKEQGNDARRGWGGESLRRRLEPDLGPPSSRVERHSPKINGGADAPPVVVRKAPKRVAPVAMNPGGGAPHGGIGGTSPAPTARAAAKRIQPTQTGPHHGSEANGDRLKTSPSAHAASNAAPLGGGFESPRSSVTLPPGSLAASVGTASPGPLTPPPLRRDSPAKGSGVQGSGGSDFLDVDFDGTGTPRVGLDDFGAGSSSDPDEDSDMDDCKAPHSPLVRSAVVAARLHAATLSVCPDVSREIAPLVRLLAMPRSLAADHPNDGWIRTGTAAHAYAASVLADAGRVVLAVGESALAALAASASLRKLRPRLHASLVRELGLCRIAARQAQASSSNRVNSWGGVNGDGSSSTSHAGVMLPAPLMAAAGPLPPLKGGGGGGVVGGGAGFGGAVNTQAAYRNREKARDALYAMIREVAGSSSGGGVNLSSGSCGTGFGGTGALGDRARSLLTSVRVENTRWFAELMVSRLVQAAAAGEADEELAAAVAPARLSRLHRRLTGESGGGAGGGGDSGRGGGGGGRGGRGGFRGGRGGGRSGRGGGHVHDDDAGHDAPSFACLFPPAQRPYVRLIEAADSHRLASALVRALVAALHALDRHAKPPEPFRKCPETVEAEDDSGRKFIAEPNTLSPGGVIPSDAAPPVGTGGLSGYGGGGGTTERMLAARAVAGVLGVLAFGSGASGAGVANERSLAPPPGVDLTGALVRATKHGELVVTVPWVVSFLRFLPWDAEAATARVYLEPLAALRRMLRSPALAPDAKAGGVDGGCGFFSTPQMALRATLAGGLGAETPTTPAACVAFARDLAVAAGNKSAPPPPPPCASLPSLPATEWRLGLDVGTRTGTREDEDPLRDWGAAVAATPEREASDQNPHPSATTPASASLYPETPPDLSRGGLDRRYVESACPALDAATAELIRSVATRRAERRAAKGGPGTKGGAKMDSLDTPTHPSRAPSAPCTPANDANDGAGGGGSAGGGAPASASAAVPPRRVTAVRTDEGGSFTQDGKAGGQGGPTPGKPPPAPSPPTPGALNPVAPTPTSASRETNRSRETLRVNQALQRAFLQQRPALHRVVDFAVDAATLAAADAASHAAAGPATLGALKLVIHAANAAAAAAPTGASPEDAWTPAFEHAVERAAMAAARDALPGAVASASADASHRAASAVAALTAPKGHGSVSSGTVSPASTSDSPGGSSGGSDSTRSSPSTVLPKDSSDALAFFDRASSHSLAASQVAADAATAAAADRVRRTLPFELHARIQSEARSALRTALSAVKAEARVRAIEARAKTPDAATEATQEPITSRHAAISHPTLVCETRRALFAACDRVSALTDDGTATNASGHGSELDDAIRDLNSTIRAVLAGDDGSCPSPSHTYDANGHDAVVDAAGLLAALLFAFPPRDAGKSVSVASGEDAWRAAAAAVSSAWRVAIGGSDDDRVRHVSDTIVAVFLNPARWIPPITGSIAGSPFTQRRAEFAAAATLTSISLSAPWRLAVQSRFLELIDAANEDTGVGCVGIAVLLRTGAAIVEGYVDAAKGEVAVGSAGPGAGELVEFGKGLMSRCFDAGESRTRRRVERALRGV